MIRIAIYWTLLVFVLLAAFRRGDPETRAAAVICVLATILSIMLVTPYAAGLQRVETSVALVDLGVLAGFVGIALRSARFWPLWVSGLQLTTVLAHALRLLQPDLVDLAYAAAMRFWSYPILLILAFAAVRSRRYRATPQPLPA
jgi:hypothetical protein